MIYHTLIVVIILLGAVVALAILASRLRVPYAILLVLGGLALGFVPGLPRVALDPNLILFLFLPPLVYASAWQISWREFRYDLRSILLLAIGLVLATTLIVAVIAHLAIPTLSWPLAFVLGALISPTDTVAASATVQRLGVARRVAAIIEGESLLNDATGLVAYRFAVAAVVSGAFSLWQASLQFFIASFGGVLIGLAVAWFVARLHRLLDDGPIEIAMTLLTPYAAYLLADRLDTSGVLAVVACGLYLSRRSPTFFSADTRLQAYAFWGALSFLLNGLIFILVGLQLPVILDALEPRSRLALIGQAALVTLVVIVVRLAWVGASTALIEVLDAYGLIRYAYSSWRNILIVGWTGMRGGVSLAAALALPLTVASSAPFPARDQLIFLCFGVILGTLVLQGLSLPVLIQRLHAPVDDDGQREALQARRATLNAGLARLDELAREDGSPEQFLTSKRQSIRRELDQLAKVDGDGDARKEQRERLTTKQRVHREVLLAERATLIELRNRNEIDDEVYRQLEREIDYDEERLQR